MVKQLYDDIEVTILELPKPQPAPTVSIPEPVYQPAAVPIPSLSVNARLRWGSRINRQEAKITNLTTIIGRADSEYHSDIEFADEEMSRRSVRIDAIPSLNDTVFTLTVQKSTNPVMVNGRKVENGESVQLPNGSTILLGKTTLVFRND